MSDAPVTPTLHRAKLGGACSVLGFLLALAIWAALGEVDVIATGEGRIIPTARVKRVQPVEPGQVVAIHVDDGDHVRSGDVLVELDASLRRADRDRLANTLAAARVESARLHALAARTLAEFTPPPGLDRDLVEAHRRLLCSELDAHDAELAGIDAATARQRAQLDGVAASIDRLARTLPLITERAAARQSLALRGHGSRLAWLELEQLRIERAQDLVIQNTRRGELAAELAGLFEQRRRVDAEFERRARARLVEAERLVVSLAQEFAKAEQHLGYQRLVSPIDGTVHQRAVHTLGGVVGAGETLMLIVPDEPALEIEALVPNRDAGFLSIGQTAQLKLEAFPFTIYGTIEGRVRDIARDAVEDPRLGPSYPVRIELLQTRLRIGGRQFALIAGMHVTVDIVTERRNVAAVLLSPLVRLHNDALRER